MKATLEDRINNTRAIYMTTELINRLSSASESIHFSWDEDTKTWCLSGETNGLGWETDDFEAETLEEAEHDANEYLLANEDK